MLSAAPFEFTTFSLPAMQLAVEVGQSAAPVGQAPQFNIVSQGGFISLDNLQIEVTGTASMGDLGVVRSGGALFFSPGNVVITNGNATTDVFLNSESVGSGFNVRPAVIPPTEQLTISQPNSEPILARDSWQRNGRDEGGSIDVQSILNGDDPVNRFESGDRLESMLANKPADELAEPEDSRRMAVEESARPADSTASMGPWTSSVGSTAFIEVTLDKSSANRTSSSNDRGISGEWARAMVFEMAGGEPAWAARPSASSQIKPSPTLNQPDNPRAEAPPPSTSVTGQQATHRAVSGRHRIAASELDLIGGGRELAELAVGARSGSSSQGFEPDAGSPAGGLAAFNVPDAAHAEVFRQWDRSETAVIRPSLYGDLRTAPIAAAPLLALLVLQRVAARNASLIGQDESNELWRVPISARRLRTAGPSPRLEVRL